MKWVYHKIYDVSKERFCIIYWNYSMAYNQMEKFLTSGPGRHGIRPGQEKLPAVTGT